MNTTLGVMGILLMPMFVIFVTYSINSIEHRADTWKSLFSLPVSKWAIYSSKYFYTVLLNALCLSLFASFILLSGNLMGLLKPELKFHDYSIAGLAFEVHAKLFLASLGILSIQFLLSLVWTDFLKPMGIGFVLTIAGIISAQSGWKYAWTNPYAHPMLALMSMKPAKATMINVDMFSKEVLVSLLVAVIAFVAGYFVVTKRSIK
jgi:hypothetical protein